jgi:hypothetical protein
MLPMPQLNPHHSSVPTSALGPSIAGLVDWQLIGNDAENGERPSRESL